MPSPFYLSYINLENGHSLFLGDLQINFNRIWLHCHTIGRKLKRLCSILSHMTNIYWNSDTINLIHSFLTTNNSHMASIKTITDTRHIASLISSQLYLNRDRLAQFSQSNFGMNLSWRNRASKTVPLAETACNNKLPS